MRDLLMKKLEFTTNPFGGVLTKTDSLPDSVDIFSELLRNSLDLWRNDGFLVAWIEIPLTKVQLIPIAAEYGFVFHHCRQDYTMMTYQISNEAFIPAFSSHYVGAGGVVLSDDGELLVVSEKHQTQKPEKPKFKLPGGTLNEGEHLSNAVEREVFEETGIDAQFESLVCFRHWHNYRYGKSDIYFVCRLKPLSKKITIQEEEISECQWMPIDEYLNAENVSEFNKEVVKYTITSPGLAHAAIDGYADPERYEFFMPSHTEFDNS